MRRKWNDINEKGIPLNAACEVMQEGGNISEAAYYQGERASGICKIEEDSDGVFKFTNIFLLKVTKWRLLT